MNELLQQRLDGELTAAQSARLDSHLADCAACARDAQAYESLFEQLATRIEVRPDFTASVMAALPPKAAPELAAKAAPELAPKPAPELAVARASAADARSTWMLPVALLLVLAVGTTLIAGGSLGAAVEGTPLALIGAVVDMITSAALAGAGLLGASWKALRLGVGELMVQSPTAMVAFGLLVIGLNGLLFSYLRRRRQDRREVREETRA